MQTWKILKNEYGKMTGSVDYDTSELKRSFSHEHSALTAFIFLASKNTEKLANPIKQNLPT